MSEDRYRILWTGEVLEKKDVQQVKQNLAALFKVDVSKVEDFFTGRRDTVKRNIDYETALKYQRALERAGAVCRIVSESGESATMLMETPQGVEANASQHVVSPKRVQGSDRYQPQQVLHVTGYSEGINIGRKDLDEVVPFTDIILASVVTGKDCRERLTLIFFIKEDCRPCIMEAAKIQFNDFLSVAAEDAVSSLRKFLNYLRKMNPSLLIDRDTDKFLSGGKPPDVGEGQLLSFVTALAQELESRGFSFPRQPVAPVSQKLQAPRAAEPTKVSPARLPPDRMVCPKCGLEQDNAADCRSCGIVVAKYRAFAGQQDESSPSPEPAEESLERDPTTVSPRELGLSLSPDFQGGVLPLVGMTLLICNPFVLPIAWGIAFFSVWSAENTSLSRGYSVKFVGRGEEIWWAPVMMCVPPVVFSCIVSFVTPHLFTFGGGISAGKVILVLVLVALVAAASLYFSYRITQWLIGSMRFSWGGELSFEGSYLGYVAWFFMTAVIVAIAALILFFTGKIIPWQIVCLAISGLSMVFMVGTVSAWFFRWIFNATTCSTGETLEWNGTGIEITWRLLILVGIQLAGKILLGHSPLFVSILLMGVYIVACCFLMHWYFKWFIERIAIQ